jgi:hypothetical protein
MAHDTAIQMSQRIPRLNLPEGRIDQDPAKRRQRFTSRRQQTHQLRGWRQHILTNRHLRKHLRGDRISSSPYGYGQRHRTPEPSVQRGSSLSGV